MIRTAAALACLICSTGFSCPAQEPAKYPTFDYKDVYAHEIKPHRRTIPHAGVSSGFNQLHLTLIVSPAGDVLDATPNGDDVILKFWPELRPEVMGWKFKPFEENGKAVTAQIDEYLDFVPPERFPLRHMPSPVIRPNSRVTITLQRTVCYGRCPAYQVTVTTRGISFEGGAFVTALGKHTDTTDPQAVRDLARKFVAADFYSMDDDYKASVTDNPTYILSISIDGHKKQVVDYVGSSVGMPAVITELEEDVDTLAHTERWIN